MQFSWLKSFGKGLQAILELAAAAALVGFVDVFVAKVDTSEELLALGVPAGAVVVVLFFVRIFINWWKVRRASLAK